MSDEGEFSKRLNAIEDEEEINAVLAELQRRLDSAWRVKRAISSRKLAEQEAANYRAAHASIDPEKPTEE